MQYEAITDKTTNKEPNDNLIRKKTNKQTNHEEHTCLLPAVYGHPVVDEASSDAMIESDFLLGVFFGESGKDFLVSCLESRAEDESGFGSDTS